MYVVPCGVGNDLRVCRREANTGLLQQLASSRHYSADQCHPLPALCPDGRQLSSGCHFTARDATGAVSHVAKVTTGITMATSRYRRRLEQAVQEVVQREVENAVDKVMLASSGGSARQVHVRVCGWYETAVTRVCRRQRRAWTLSWTTS